MAPSFGTPEAAAGQVAQPDQAVNLATVSRNESTAVGRASRVDQLFGAILIEQSTGHLPATSC